MSQRRYYEYKDDDDTLSLNFRYLGIINQGRYAGYDAILAAGLTLTLSPSVTGAPKTQLGGTSSVKYSICCSRQGVIITEDGNITLPISAGDPSLPRIDAIVVEHNKVNVVGGSPAIYSVIPGTPASNPTAPTLTPTQELTFVILGYLYVPAAMASLTDAGVFYTQASIPDFANDGTIAHQDRENDFQELQSVRGLEEYHGIATLNTAASATVIFLKDNTATNEDLNRNFYILQTTSTPAIDVRVTAFNAVPVPASGRIRRFTLFSPTVSIRFDGAFFGRNYFLKAGSAVTIAYDNAGNYYFEEGDEAALGRVNRFWKQQILNNKQSSVGTLASGLVALSPDYNVYSLGNSSTPNNIIRGISTSQSFDQGTTTGNLGGGICYLIVSGTDALNIQPFDFSVPVGYKPIWTPITLTNYVVKGNTVLVFVEDEFFWRLVKVDTHYQNTAAPSLTVSSGGGTATLNSSTTRVQYDGNKIFLRFELNITIAGAVSGMNLNLGLPHTLPINQASCGMVTSNSSALFVRTLSGNILSLTTTGAANFPAATTNYIFSGVFEITY